MQTLPQLQLKIQLLTDSASLPKKANPSDACFDLAAAEDTVLPAGTTGFVGLGWAMELEPGWEARIRGRSGLASRGIVAHHGTIDHLYRKEVKVIMHNLTAQDFEIKVGDRVAQLSCAPVYPVALVEAEIIPTTRGGFGSTGR